jgi:uncharacterized RDD family membrane protein YckC
MPSTPPHDGLLPESAPDKLTIETPEQTALEFAVAGIGSRFLAILIDSLIQSGVGIAAALLLLVLGISLATMGSSAGGLWVGAFFVLFYFLLYFGYYAFFEIIWNGQTPGKRQLGIRVIKDNGRPLTPAESIGRNLMRIVDWLPFFYGIGIVCAFFSKGNKRLGDLVVGSLVVRETSLGELKPVWQTAPAEDSQLLHGSGPLGADKLTPQEAALIETYLSRRSSLDPALRRRMADEVLARVRSKLNLPEGTAGSSDDLLEALSVERRTTGRFSR